MQTIVGHITLTSSDNALNPVPSFCTTPIVVGQWVKGAKCPYNLQVVNNSLSPDIPTQG